MKTIKTIKTITLLVFLFLGTLLKAQNKAEDKSNGLLWHTDILKANEISKTSGKPLFAFFTGSDWCGWCRKLQNDVFSKPEFISWAKKNVILLELDFPRGKTLSPELTQQNNSLQQTFQVSGYPTVWLFYLNQSSDAAKYDIEALGSLGYPQGSVKGKEEVKFLSDAKSYLAKKRKS